MQCAPNININNNREIHLMYGKLSLSVALLCTALTAGATDHPLTTDRFKPTDPAVTVPDNGVVIRSETQFAEDYAEIIEKVADGVYLFTDGDLAGKVVTIGLAGLEYDIARQHDALRQSKASGKGAKEAAQLLRRLEEQRARYLKAKEANKTKGTNSPMAFSSSVINCSAHYYDPWSRSWKYASWGGWATVEATTELYLDRGDGNFNWYYARASASANAHTFGRPFGVPYYGPDTWVQVSATNRQTGETKFFEGPYAGASTGYVYSGPAFSHDLAASAFAGGSGAHCWGYASVSDEMVGG